MSTKTTKKTAPKKQNHKKRNTKKKKPSNKTLIPFLFILLFALLATTASYFLLFKNSSNENIKEPLVQIQKEIKEVKKEEKLPKYQFEEITKEFNVDYEAKPKIEPKPKTESKKETTKIDVVDKIEEAYKKKELEKELQEKPEKETKSTISSKPKLAIIIDDVTTNYQIKKANEVGYTINLAFLPPTNMHKNSAKVAQTVSNHMIHVPLEASPKFTAQEAGVLNTSDNYETIEKRVMQLRKWFPNATYANNHTGSVFTQDESSMNNLFRALKKYNFIFVDSRTSPNSVAQKYAKKYDMPYYVRNTFLDNNKDKVYIKKQLLKAVNLAKKNGHAIAIGHPYKETFEVLKNSQEILQDVQAVFVHQL